MKHRIVLLALACILAGCSQTNPRITEDFNFGWKFALGDSEAFAEPSFNDAEWRSLHLPHDWSIEGEFSKDNPSTPGGGALPGGIGWYRKHFKTPELYCDMDGNPGRCVLVEFDGVFMNSTIYINGMEVGTRPYGYSSFQYDLTEFLNPSGEDNLIAVRCDNKDLPNSRWYAGCGIYRNVRLITTSAAHIDYNGVWAKPVSASESEAVFAVNVNLTSPTGAIFDIDNAIYDAKGHKVASGYDTLRITKPHMWDTEDPYLYNLVTSISYAGKVLDIVETPIGVRTAEFDVEHGFFLNGRRVELKGVCLHHDMGCIGTAVHMRALERQLTILKEMGCNAIRTSHNPPAPELLKLCDEMGFLVMDEAMDMWRIKKTKYDYARFFDEWHVRDVQDFIRRDRNHPSIIMWSVGNEIMEQWNFGEEESLPVHPSIELTKEMVALVKELDDTRAVTSGCNETQKYNNLFRSKALDVYGFNYHTVHYDLVREWYPNKPLIGSETASAIQSRGVYWIQPDTVFVHPTSDFGIYETKHHQLTGYDSCRVPWGNTHEEAWYMTREREYLAGCFVWTGFDYLGEPTPYTWPSRSSYFGIVDLAGFPKDAYWMYMSEWTDKTVLHLFPHWNWKAGDLVSVWAYYSNADEVELFLNGRSLGRDSKEGSKLHAQWDKVPFEAGTIEVVSYKDGAEVARVSRSTTGAPAALRLTPDRAEISADGYDLSYVTIEAIDVNGNAIPDADTMLHFEVSGNGELFGVDNGNAADVLSLKGQDKALFSGKALAVVRSIRGEKGEATLTVSSELGSYSTKIVTK